MLDDAIQQWQYYTILVLNKISNTGKFTIMVHPDIFVEDGVWNSHCSG